MRWRGEVQRTGLGCAASFDLWAMRVDVAKIQHAMIDIAEHVMRDVYSEQKCFVKGICGRKGTDRSADACAGARMVGA